MTGKRSRASGLRAVDRVRLGDWVALDTETTGLGPSAEIVEIAVVAADGEVLVDSLVRPVGPVGASSIHGLSAERLAGAPGWSSVWSRTNLFLRHRVVVAHHAAFDLRMMRQSCSRHGLPLVVPSSVLCVTRLLGCSRVRSLQALCDDYGLGLHVQHRAAADAELVRRLVVEALSRSRGAEEGG